MTQTSTNRTADPLGRDDGSEDFVSFTIDGQLFGVPVVKVQDVLSRQPFLAGEGYSLADAALTPFVNRLDMLGLDFMWRETRPNLTGWIDRIRERPNFDRAVRAFLTEADGQRFAAAQDLELAPRVRAFLRAR